LTHSLPWTLIPVSLCFCACYARPFQTHDGLPSPQRLSSAPAGRRLPLRRPDAAAAATLPVPLPSVVLEPFCAPLPLRHDRLLRRHRRGCSRALARPPPPPSGLQRRVPLALQVLRRVQLLLHHRHLERSVRRLQPQQEDVHLVRRRRFRATLQVGDHIPDATPAVQAGEAEPDGCGRGVLGGRYLRGNTGR
jgi:hypothetical protein